MAYPDDDKVVECLGHLKTLVQSIAEFELRCEVVYDDDDAMDALKGLTKWPAAVIQYEGMRKVTPQGTNPLTSDLGNSVVMQASILLVNQGQALIKTDTKVASLLLLGQLRRKILGKQSPSGHKWGFMVEAPVEMKKGLLFWVQRWQVPLQLQFVS